MKTLNEYYGGHTIEHVAGVIQGLNAKGMQACVSVLPRFHIRKAGIEAEKAKYLAILPELEKRGLKADLTVKLSQLGQRWKFRECVAALEEITVHLAEHDSFLWVDMEQSTLVDVTIEAFTEVAAKHSNIGLCLQTYLTRTENDFNALIKRGWPLRLVKGYYREWPPTAFRTWRETTDCFARLIPPLIEGSRRPAIGTHDPYLVEEARKALSRVPAGGRGEGAALEFQFFLGAKPKLAEQVAREGRPVRVYIPFGALVPYLLHSLPYMDISRNLQRVLGFETIR